MNLFIGTAWVFSANDKSIPLNNRPHLVLTTAKKEFVEKYDCN